MRIFQRWRPSNSRRHKFFSPRDSRRGYSKRPSPARSWPPPSARIDCGSARIKSTAWVSRWPRKGPTSAGSKRSACTPITGSVASVARWSRLSWLGRRDAVMGRSGFPRFETSHGTGLSTSNSAFGNTPWISVRPRRDRSLLRKRPADYRPSVASSFAAIASYVRSPPGHRDNSPPTWSHGRGSVKSAACQKNFPPWKP